MAFTLRFTDSNHIRFGDAVAILGEGKARTAFRRGLNRVGNTARTKTIRALAKQVGLPQNKVRSFGAIRTRRANAARLEYSIEATGRAIPLKEFSARQFGYGVRAKPWGTSRRFESAFIFAGSPGSGQFVSNGDVFIRTSSASYPIRKLFGPSIPEEIVKDQSAEAFEDAALDLGPRIAHEVRVITKGIVS